MKKTYLLIIAAALAFAGCSKVGPEHSDPNAWMYDESLPVPVMLGTPGAEVLTKVGIGNDDLPTDPVGIFALDKDADSENWGDASPSCLLVNEKATIVGSNITFDKTKYYPLESSHNFTFYSYYPYESNLYTKLVGSQYRITYTMTGRSNRDILWAKKEADQITYSKQDGSLYTMNGYNAAYMRKGGEVPKLIYQHMLTALTFKLKSTAEDAEKLKNANAIITRLVITDTYEKADLIIADKNDDNNSGTLDVSAYGKTKDLALLGEVDGNPTSTFAISMIEGTPYDKNDKIISDVNSETPVEYYIADFGEGSGILLVPKSVSGEDFTGTLELKTYDLDGEGNKINELTHTLPLELKADFEAGKIYNFTIVVKAPEEITATAEITGWGDAIEGEVGYIGDETYND